MKARVLSRSSGFSNLLIKICERGALRDDDDEEESCLSVVNYIFVSMGNCYCYVTGGF